MKAVIFDRCKKVCTDFDSVEVIVDRDITIRRDFNLCRGCKKWPYKKLGVKESLGEREKRV